MKDQTDIEDAEIVEEVAEEDPVVEIDEDVAEIEGDDDQGEAEVAEDVQEDVVEEESDTIEVRIGEPEEDETPVIRTLRKKFRESEREKKELQKKLAEQSTQEKAAELGPKPKLADFDYDEDKFAESIEAWNEQKRKVDADKERQQKDAESFNAEWNEKLTAYQQRRNEIGVDDFEDTVEAQFRSTFDDNQQSVVIDVCQKPELVILALSQNDELAAELAGEKNPVRLAAKIVRLETKLKVSSVKPKAKPEKRPAATVPGGSVNPKRQLDKLKAEADKTGDFTDYFAAKRKLNQT